MTKSNMKNYERTSCGQKFGHVHQNFNMKFYQSKKKIQHFPATSLGHTITQLNLITMQRKNCQTLKSYLKKVNS